MNERTTGWLNEWLHKFPPTRTVAAHAVDAILQVLGRGHELMYNWTNTAAGDRFLPAAQRGA
jgi:hypothetical protein